MRYANGVLFPLSEVIETKAFSRRIDDLLGPDDRDDLYWYLACTPDAGRVIPGSAGLRKLKWKAEGRGKRGGVRIIYYWFKERELVLLLTAFGKNERADLSREEVGILRKLVEAEFKQ